jgi:hypothetical protein
MSKNTISAKLILNQPVIQQHTKVCLERAQKVIDSEVLRYSKDYTPMDTGMLIKSGTLGTIVGSGLVQWIAPYARKQYYDTTLNHSHSRTPQGGPKWFERMKISHKEDILRAAQSAIDGKV